MRRAVVSVVVALAFVAACSGGGGPKGQPLTDSFPRLDGTTASFTDYRGKPVVVNFFSETCIPCRTEMPALEQVHQELGPKVVFLGMNAEDAVEDGRKLIADTGITWDIGRDPRDELLQRLGGAGLPSTFLLDSEGRVVFSHLGALTAGDLRNALRDHKLIS
jgi:thiol-disulfide isomerase/thioredoxin